MGNLIVNWFHLAALILVLYQTHSHLVTNIFTHYDSTISSVGVSTYSTKAVVMLQSYSFWRFFNFAGIYLNLLQSGLRNANDYCYTENLKIVSQSSL